MAILIDLDQTLIDSRQVDQLRRSRQWATIYPTVPQLQPYPGITELLQELKMYEVPICIVTSSPSPYCQRVVAHWGWQISATVCYHDTERRKPYPDPILLGLHKLGREAGDAVAIGDAAKDTYAARSANVQSIGALWGSLERQPLLNSKPDILCETVDVLRTVLLEKFALNR